ncbi:hypothetical protein EVC04_220 [Rhizobium phage RHph_I1_9]|uniref:Uncharacterized protein n=1 Tax=Rhizobium phage RHph_I1_9 TaxID=2509729 RepID=A0A7S5R9T6_9CAUD|nr:hypothetical protein PP936_gp220 [Rhizobium phage RHph_I1_9]QIG73657.1 hypothetical protein EVC04_220 [Rhizobium phage RHph_I1_9]
MRAIGKLVGLFLFFIFLLAGGMMITKIFLSPVAVVSKTFDADNIIYNYEWFKRQYNDIIAFNQKIDIAQSQISRFEESAGPRTNWTFEDKQEANRLNSVVLGLRNQRESMIAEYNAKSSMVNRSIFKTGDLPETIN